jgi:hypothetical protein
MIHARAVPLTLLALAAAATLPACELVDDMPAGANSILAVGQGPTPAEAAEMALDQYNADNRFKGVRLLANSDFGAQAPYLALYVDSVDDPDPGVRWAAARALGLHGSPEHVELILPLLRDDDAQVRAEAARTLQRLHNPAAVEPLIVTLKQDTEQDPAVRAEAADALGQYADPAVLQALISSLNDPALAVNRSAVASLKTLTGQDFGVDTRAWLDWIDLNKSALFAARQPYTYPAFSRDKRLVEYLPLPFIRPARNEAESLPVGMNPSLDS